jgi:hypothetical protein
VEIAHVEIPTPNSLVQGSGFRVQSLYECRVEVIIPREPSMLDACTARRDFYC